MAANDTPFVHRAASGKPDSRARELRLLLRAAYGFLHGFRSLRGVGPCVTVFGSARTPASHPHYRIGQEVGRRLAELGFAVMTGGGPGLMEAANRGAKEAGGRSIGCNIRLPVEQDSNPYVDRSITCHHFFVRKVLLFRYACGFVALPGGVGTMDEVFEALALVQTGKIEPVPIVLIGAEYWRPFGVLLEQMLAHATIDAQDLHLVTVTDDLDEAMARFADRAIGQRGADAGRVVHDTPQLTAPIAPSCPSR